MDQSMVMSAMYPTRQEFAMLEARMANAEQAIQNQNAQIRVMMAHLQEGMVIAAANGTAAGARERSRTPVPLSRKQTLPTPPPGTPQIDVYQFCQENGIDDKCRESLMAQPSEVQQYVMRQGPVEGRNPSAMVTGRIAKVNTEFVLPTTNIDNKVEEFIVANNLDDKCAETLRGQSAQCQAAVMGMGSVIGNSPSAMMMGRIKNFQKGLL
eukprot:gnl/TRDRNA2_/TRDRNA2_90874_c0_seq1.p1 gnl/TRDRNA2_/TRDRNA2_90874_c0~~gnl/TRDRNA2_/TRDRNA2_90874_c0_seq1.p1  ORF type:complete len:231 (-),score=29.16 gnl/TRDRNA2_/TRDRNA2_90874_c0_seq1:128-757(-)